MVISGVRARARERQGIYVHEKKKNKILRLIGARILRVNKIKKQTHSRTRTHTRNKYVPAGLVDDYRARLARAPTGRLYIARPREDPPGLLASCSHAVAYGRIRSAWQMPSTGVVRERAFFSRRPLPGLVRKKDETNLLPRPTKPA